jgi:uncharacterized protein (DUF2062 family)
MGVLLILACTLIGYLVGSAPVGLAAGVIIVMTPWAMDEWDKSAAARRRRRRMRKR